MEATINPTAQLLTAAIASDEKDLKHYQELVDKLTKQIISHNLTLKLIEEHERLIHCTGQ